MHIRNSSTTRNGKTTTTAQIVAARSFGRIRAIMMAWKELKISQALRQAARKSKAEYNIVAHIQTADQQDIFAALQTSKPTMKSLVVSDF